MALEGGRTRRVSVARRVLFFALPVALMTVIGYAIGRLVNYVLPNTVLGFIMGVIAWGGFTGGLKRESA